MIVQLLSTLIMFSSVGDTVTFMPSDLQYHLDVDESGTLATLHLDFVLSDGDDNLESAHAYYDSDIIYSSLNDITMRNIYCDVDYQFINFEFDLYVNGVYYDTCSFDYQPQNLETGANNTLTSGYFQGEICLFNKHYYNLIYEHGFTDGGDYVEELYNADWLGWIGRTLSSVLDIELFMGFTLGGIFGTCIVVAVMIWFLKMFSGG